MAININNREFNGDRLKSARIIRGMTLTELAEKTGISKQSVSLYENNKNVPDYTRVISMARVLEFPMDFFFGKDKHPALTETTYFRSQASATKKDRQAQSAKLELIARMYEVLNNYIEFPYFNDPKIEFNGYESAIDNTSEDAIREIEEAAAKVRRCWGIEDGPIVDLQYLLEQNGVLVTGFKTDGDGIDAFSQRTVIDGESIYLIGIDLGRNNSHCRIRFDMGHELGHIVLHPWSEDIDALSKDDFKNRERQANMFASALLLPAESFGRDISSYPTDFNYYVYLKKKWGVSISAMLMRSCQLKYIHENQYTYLMRQLSKNGGRINEPGDTPYIMNESIFQNAIEMLFDNNILTPSTLLQDFKNNGVSLYPHDIEQLLHLNKGTLDTGEGKQTPLIQLKLVKDS